MNKRLSDVIVAFGMVLVLVALCLFAVSEFGKKSAEKNCAETVSRLYNLMPSVKQGVIDGRAPSMPMLEVDGEDYVGIVEIPLYETVLPVGANWENQRVTDCPCRYTGSVYDKTLIIGGSDNEGQFDFMKIITTGDKVYFTDVSGNRFSYEVCNVEKAERVTEDLSAECDLILYARNTYSLDYTVVKCELR